MDYSSYNSLGGISVRYIQFFLAAAELENFTRAAESLGTHQSQISRSINVLEQELGAALFVREGKAVRLTPAGAELQKGWKSALYELGFAAENARALAARDQSVVHIADDFSMDKQRYLNPLVQEFSGRYPEVEVRIEQYLSDGTVEGVLSRRANVGFTVYYNIRHMDPGLVEWKLLIPSPLYAWVHESSGLYGKKQITVGELAGEPLVVVEQHKSLHYNEMFQNLFGAAGIRPNIQLSLPNIFSLEYYRKTGNLTFLANNIVAAPQREDVTPIPIEGTEAGLIAFWRRGRQNKNMRLFLRFMDELVEQGKIK